MAAAASPTLLWRMVSSCMMSCSICKYYPFSVCVCVCVYVCV
ncbi:hypothetical protein E2C01_076822 [Portunus trituberculatus]|uniref:Uncharacterized protein n=1 Tax=Portunus trituberculatus TaxID=210409 RepID=A0A5B7IPP7_PORTR|nr:hypothetical protein [Portunus trituberculatus]